MWNSYEDGAGYISNALPSYCTAYNGNAYTDNQGTALCRRARARRLLGRGRQVRDAALAEYNQRIAAEDAARRANDYGGGGSEPVTGPSSRA